MTEAGPARQMTNLQLRILSSIVMVAAVLGVSWIGGTAFRIFASLLAALVLYEWFVMTRGAGGRRYRLAAAVALVVVMAGAVLGYPEQNLFALLIVATLLAFAANARGGQGHWGTAGLAYAGLSGLSLACLRGWDEPGLIAVMFLFVVVWATDICAYFVGRSLGGPKLAPAISPGKTQSGALGGAAGGVVAGVLLGAYAGLTNLAVLALVAFVLSVVSQIGDLFESWVKRRHGVKDSGHIIPGHGGVMDRVDGLVAAAFALYAVGALMAGPDKPAHALFVG